MKTNGNVFNDCLELKGLIKNLEETKKLAKTDQLSAIVFFLKNLSSWHNKEGVKNLIDCLRRKNKLDRYSKLIEKLRLLQKHFDQTAPNTNGGVNRTPRGQTASAETIFLGGLTYNTPNQSVNSWERIRTKSKNAKATCQIISEQAKRFMQIHIDSMLNLIEEIETEISKITVKPQKIIKKEGIQIHSDENRKRLRINGS